MSLTGLVKRKSAHKVAAKWGKVGRARYGFLSSPSLSTQNSVGVCQGFPLRLFEPQLYFRSDSIIEQALLGDASIPRLSHSHHASRAAIMKSVT
jgi:hypothetical protein